MNLYEEHYEILKKYKEANKNYNNVLEKKALLVLKTQPGAVDTTKEIVNGNRNIDKFALFVEKLEKIDPEIQRTRNERDLHEYFLKKKTIELKNSKEIKDNIYYYKYVERLKVRHIPYKVNYSKRQIYRYLEEIEESLKMAQNGTKVM